MPSFDLPGLPFRMTPGIGSADLVFSMRGSALSGRWAVRSNKVAWTADTAGRKSNDIERLVWRVIGGLNDLSLVADKVKPLKRQVAQVQAQATQRIGGERQRLDKVEAELDAQLKRMTEGLAPGLELPKIKL